MNKTIKLLTNIPFKLIKFYKNKHKNESINGSNANSMIS